ncbi:cellulase family glycosylhydrolase [Pseudomonas sp. dw_358]|uniref:cellulase family glycosylhydrolase n=1 Tax=Pseudomonas sp. dw_358 TaxID=2720083 RepID=UPI001BD381F9|nr:cellulase family glycosylhydrolase [Pseudomonas sp. dw_358]
MLGTATVVSTDPYPAADATARRGINLSGMEYSETTLPGAAGTNYFLPTLANFQYWAGKGMNIVRLPIYLARWFDTPGGPLNATGQAHLDLVQGYANATGLVIVLDGHDYASRYINGATQTLGSSAYPIAAWASDWQQVAKYIKGKSAFWGIDFFNEPQNLAVQSSEFNYTSRAYKQLMRDPQFRNPDTGANWFVTAPFSISTTGGRSGGGHLVLNATTAQYKVIRHWNNGNDTGYAVKANTTYVMSFYVTQATTQGTNTLTINAGGNSGDSGAVALATLSITDQATATRVSVQFTTGASQTLIYWDMNIQGVIGTGSYDDWNLNEGTTLQTFVPWGSDGGTVATNTTAQNAAIAAVRSVGYTGWLLWEGDRSTGLASFGDNYGYFPDVPWVDPLNRTQMSLHYYLDPNYSGVYDATTGQWTQATRDRLAGQMQVVGTWSAAKGVTVFLGEYGVPSDTSTSSVNYRTDFDSMMSLMDQYSFNGTYWAAGDGFTSITSIGPVSGADNTTVLPIVQAHDWTHVGTPANAAAYNGAAITSNGSTVTYN